MLVTLAYKGYSLSCVRLAFRFKLSLFEKFQGRLKDLVREEQMRDPCIEISENKPFALALGLMHLVEVLGVVHAILLPIVKIPAHGLCSGAKA